MGMREKGRGGNEEEGRRVRRREAVKTRKREKDGQEIEDVRRDRKRGWGAMIKAFGVHNKALCLSYQ